MKGFPGFVLFLFLILLHHSGAVAQTTPDLLKQMRSTVTEKVDGKEYYIHTVKRGQTLYMISKAYGVDVNDLIRENPQVKEGIRACLLYTSPSPRDGLLSRMPSSA